MQSPIANVPSFYCDSCFALQHVYHTWTAKDLVNEEAELKAFDKLSKSIQDDTKWGWRTLDGQAELQQEVRASLVLYLMLIGLVWF